MMQGTTSAQSGAVLYAKDVQRVAVFYSAVAGLQTAGGDDDHVVLESPHVQLVVVRIPNEIASSIEITTPPARRTRTPVKLVFFVPRLAAARASAEAHGGGMNPADTEWSFQGSLVCDGYDPEGNVIQLREHQRQP